MSDAGAGPATLVLSFDVELGWGALDSDQWRRREARGVYRRTREAMRTLTRRMRELEVGATWAVVGALLERRGEHALDHLSDGRRRRVERALREAEETTFWGVDVLEAIERSGDRHEIGCHGYTHLGFTDEEVDEGSIRAELSYARRLLAPHGRDVSTLVYPGNRERYVEAVRDCGFRAVRGGHGDPATTGWASRLCSAVALAPPLSKVTEACAGLVRTTGSLFFSCGRQGAYRLPVVRFQGRRALDAAERRGGVVHVWCHPFNLAEHAGLLDAFVALLEDAVRRRDRGRVEIVTIRELAKAWPRSGAAASGRC
jgi:peptidoglycan/xylan/chitin deacetylase (PgdA/CDA1 family)